MAEQDDRDALVEVLAAHEAIGWVDGWTCACGIDVGLPPEHQVHLADAILASDVLAQRDRRVAAEALREARAALLDDDADADVEVALGGIDWILGWLRERANEIEAGGQ